MLISAIKQNQLTKNIALSAIIKVMNILFVVLIVRKSIDALGMVEYGIWTAITSISTWISLLDIGIGNGLRVELRRCFIDQNWREARMLLNTAYIFIALFMAFVLAVFVGVWYFTDWGAFFNIKDYSIQSINFLVLLTVSGLMMQLIFSLIQPVINANLHSGLIGIFTAISNGLILAYLFLNGNNGINILQYGFFSAFVPIAVYLGFSFFYFKKYAPQIIPDFKETNFKKIRPILVVSGKFFFMQISSVLMYQMTSFLIIRYFTPTEVAEYNIAYRYFNLFQMVFMTLLQPLWSMSTDAYLRNDLEWIEKTIKKYVIWSFFLFVAMVFGYFMRDFVFKIWLNNVSVSPKIAFYVAVHIAIICWNCIFLYVVTGAGKINLQFILAWVTMLLVFPLTHVFVKTFNMGIDGIFMANILILLIFSVLIPIQTYYLLKTNKQNYWLS
jgi:O-antigen/teichoic acid export membrane protein